MGDVDVLDMLFNGDGGILDLHASDSSVFGTTTTTTSCGTTTTTTDLSQQQQQLANTGGSGGDELVFGSDLHHSQQPNSKMFDSAFIGMESDWPSSSLLSPSMESIDHNDFFNTLFMDSNLPDDIKQQQQFQQPQHKQVSDHAYSITPSSPHSDSGVSSSGPYSPSSSSNGIEDVAFDVDRDLFGPLGLEKYNEFDQDMATAVDPMLLDSLSDCSSNSPALAGNESPVRFDFEELSRNPSQSAVQGLTISTDETTKVIKVISVNGSSRNQTVQPYSSKQKSVTTDSPYPELMLSDEEKDLLRKEGITLPSHLPLTREEEKVLRSVRRRIRNKASARNSRRKKQDYMEALEKRVKRCTDEKRQLEKKVIDLEKRNSSLIGQLKKLQKLVTDGTRQTAKTGTCAMILALSFALVLLPNYRSLVGNSDSAQDTLMDVPSDMGGRPARSLLSKPDDYIHADQYTDKSFSYIPFLNTNNLPSMVSPAKTPVDDPIDDGEVHADEPIDDMVNLKRGFVSSFTSNDEKVIHMEITKLPDGDTPVGAQVINNTAKDGHITPGQTVRQSHVNMDVSDEL